MNAKQIESHRKQNYITISNSLCWARLGRMIFTMRCAFRLGRDRNVRLTKKKKNKTNRKHCVCRLCVFHSKCSIYERMGYFCAIFFCDPETKKWPYGFMTAIKKVCVQQCTEHFANANAKDGFCRTWTGKLVYHIIKMKFPSLPFANPQPATSTNRYT